MIRRDTGWTLYKWFASIVSLALILLMTSPLLEPIVAPVRTFNTIDNVTRTPDEICWDWHSVKKRNVSSPDIDVFIETNEERFPWTIWERDTHLPWARSRAVGVGPHIQAYCAPLPANIKPWTHVKIKQKLWYPSMIGPWNVPVKLPDVISAPLDDEYRN